MTKFTRQDIYATAKELSNWGRWGEDDQIGTLNNVTPTLQISDWGDAGSPRACSGDIYRGEPTTSPGRHNGSPDAGAENANPTNVGLPLGRTRMLSHLMSRCTIWLSWTYCNAPAIVAMIRTTTTGGVRSSTLPPTHNDIPSTNSITKYG